MRCFRCNLLLPNPTRKPDSSSPPPTSHLPPPTSHLPPPTSHLPPPTSHRHHPPPPPPPRLLLLSISKFGNKHVCMQHIHLSESCPLRGQNLSDIMPRMAREWHPIEEFTALTSVTRVETNSSRSDVRDRLLSMMRLRGDSSEGLQGGGGSRKSSYQLVL